MFSSLERLITGIGAVLALAPTAALLAGLVPVPPDFNDFLLFVIGFVGPMTFLIVLILKRRILRLGDAALAGLLASASIGGLGFAWLAYDATASHVFKVGFRTDAGRIEEERFVRPDRPTGDLKRVVEVLNGGSWELAVIGPQGADVRRWMAEQSRNVQARIALFVALAEILLLSAFLCACWHVLRAMDREASRKAPASGAT